MKTARSLSLAFGLAALILSASAGKCQNSLPVVHTEPVTIQILDGKAGAPLARVHLDLAAGYDDRDLRRGLWSAEVVTDAKGRASLPTSLRDFPLLAVWVEKHKLCQTRGRSSDFILDDVRYQGLSATNHCGIVTADDAPGVLHVFVKSTAKDLPPPPATPPAKPPAK